MRNYNYAYYVVVVSETNNVHILVLKTYLGAYKRITMKYMQFHQLVFSLAYYLKELCKEECKPDEDSY